MHVKTLLCKCAYLIQDLIALRRVVVLGDSHAQVFLHRVFRSSFPLTTFEVCSVGGATASGLDNPKSTTAAYEIFRNKMNTTPEGSLIIIMLGEVDTGFVIWYRAKIYGESVEVMLKKAIGNYSKFVSEVALKHRTIVISTPLPTISDDNEWGEVANLRKEITATQLERTQLTLSFNETMKQYCHENNIVYLDLDPESLGDNGLLSVSLLNDDKTDHHYDQQKHAQIILPKLQVELNRIGR